MPSSPKIIFILIDWFLPAYKGGGPIQSVGNLVQLYAKDNIQYRIFCGDKDHDGTAIEVEAYDKWVDFNPHTKVWYATAATRNIASIKKEVDSIKPDILFVNGIYSILFNFKPLLFLHVPRTVISVRGMLHPGALSQKSLKKKAYLMLWKLLGFHKENIYHASTEEEKTFILNAMGKQSHVMIAPNFPKQIPFQPCITKQVGILNLVSIALVSPMKNHLEVLKALVSLKENIWYHIYGPIKDAAYWETCKSIIASMPVNIQVIYHGDVNPLRIQEALATGEVFILPSKSENFGHAIYEALTAGKPIITSTTTPWNNLQQHKAGINVDMALSPQKLGEAISTFAAMDPINFSEWNKGAAAFAEHSINLNAIEKAYDQLFL
ncbi:MAG: glycosyltransferase [Ferruginibacter sp.]